VSVIDSVAALPSSSAHTVAVTLPTVRKLFSGGAPVFARLLDELQTTALNAEVAAVMHARESLGTARRGLVVANPLPENEQVDPTLHERLLTSGLAAAATSGIAGKDVTPFLLDFFHRESEGVSLTANIRIILRNAALAAEIAVAASASP